MNLFGGDLGQRLQHEAPFRQTRMRDFQTRLPDNQVAEEQYVQVGCAVRAGFAVASQLFLDLQAPRQQLPRSESSAEAEDGVDEVAAEALADRRGSIQMGGGDEFASRQAQQRHGGPAQQRGAVAQVRAEADPGRNGYPSTGEHGESICPGPPANNFINGWLPAVAGGATLIAFSSATEPMGKKKNDGPGGRVLATNRKAFHNYYISERFEAPHTQLGTEVKSLREGRANLKESYCRPRDGELWLLDCHISPYHHGTASNT